MTSHLPEGYVWGPEDKYILDATKETQPDPDLFIMNMDSIVAEVRSDCGPCVQLWFPKTRYLTARLYGEDLGFIPYITDLDFFMEVRRMLSSLLLCKQEGIPVPDCLKAKCPNKTNPLLG